MFEGVDEITSWCDLCNDGNRNRCPFFQRQSEKSCAKNQRTTGAPDEICPDLISRTYELELVRRIDPWICGVIDGAPRREPCWYALCLWCHGKIVRKINALLT